MAKQTINIGTVADDGTGDTLRAALDKCNDNFDEVYAGSVAAYEAAGGITTHNSDGAAHSAAFAAQLAAGTQVLVPTIIHNETLGSNGRFSITVPSNDYKLLQIYLLMRSSAAGTNDTIRLIFNDDTTATNYRRNNVNSISGTAGAAIVNNNDVMSAVDSTGLTDSAALAIITIHNPRGSTWLKTAEVRVHNRWATASIATILQTIQWSEKTALSNIKIQPDGYATDAFLSNSTCFAVGSRVGKVLADFT